MPFDDDLADMLADAGEPLTLASQPIVGLFDAQGEVVLDGIVSTATVAEVLAEVGAQPNQLLERNGTSYVVRQVLPLPPDGALHQLILAKV